MKPLLWVYQRLFLIVICTVWLIAGEAKAIPKKVLLVGSNLAPADLEPLRYTQNDVEKMAEVLHELGGVSGEDIMLIQDPSSEALEQALLDLQRNIVPNTQLIFYYSGHADDSGLLLGTDVFPLEKIRAFLDDDRAQIRLGIIDACQSGALVRKKGGEMLPGLNIRLDAQPTLNGAVLITSSSASESSLEIDELGGALFTHFFVSGLRGAADNDQDGMVTLEEVFSYSSNQTLNHSSVSRAGAQHPTFEYNLSGQRQLIMSVLDQSSALVFGPNLIGSFLVFDRSRNRVVVEIEKKPGEQRTIQLPAGDYYVKKRLPSAVLIQKIALATDSTIAVAEHRMHTVPYEEDVTKGRPSKVFQPTWKYGAPFLENTAYTMRRKEKLLGIKSFAYGLNDDVTLQTSFFVPSLFAKYRLLNTNNVVISLSSGYSIDFFSLKDERYSGIFLTTGTAVSWQTHPSFTLSTGIDWELESWSKDESSVTNLLSLWGSGTWLPTENDLLQLMAKGTTNDGIEKEESSIKATIQYGRRWNRMRVSAGVEYNQFLLSEADMYFSPVLNVWWRW